MTKKPDKDEYLEQLWYMKEEGKTSIESLKTAMAGAIDLDLIQELSLEGLVVLSPNATQVGLTGFGETSARRIIRAHRIAERLLHDVIGGDFEMGACEFEHTTNPELVDGICTLLGHPKECPHGKPIPAGDCCQRQAKTADAFVLSLSELNPGDSARIAYINSRSDQMLHRLEGLCLKPGAWVRLHQNYPSYVIECEGASIALDEEVVSNICVWKNSDIQSSAEAKAAPSGEGQAKPLGRFARIFGKK